MYNEIKEQKLAVRLNKIPSKGFVYLLRIKGKPEWIKVGRTSKPNKRLTYYKTHYPFEECEYIVVLPTDHMNRLESLTILALKEKCEESLRREWFKIEEDVAIACLNSCLKKKATKEHAKLIRQGHKL